MIRPITVSPFPYQAFEDIDFGRVKGILDVEMSIPAQMKWDVEYAAVHEDARSKNVPDPATPSDK